MLFTVFRYFIIFFSVLNRIDKANGSSDVIERDSEKVDEFDSSSDKDIEAGSADQNEEVFQGTEIGRSATFLLGARSSFGRAIRFNNCLVYS